MIACNGGQSKSMSTAGGHMVFFLGRLIILVLSTGALNDFCRDMQTSQTSLQ